MAGTTISGSYTTSVTLSMPATQNPAKISGTGRINVTATSGSALYGTKAAAWAVYNYGTLIGPVRGVFLVAGGTVTNESGGLIRGGTRGVDITGAAGAVTNAGSIAGGSQQGVRLTAGGSVTNASGGQISGGAIDGAIYIRHGARSAMPRVRPSLGRCSSTTRPEPLPTMAQSTRKVLLLTRCNCLPAAA